ncbi:unnamed protein product [Cylicostephanus goldi]|uniref:SLC41A/MgtE integral membrane domain-containing protein n=1 Tax=Cylicostephanus goldi TaxID=71465 RepID=A0A3P6TKM7_CYLGO|nr:unnamed protein product [Cylicostephanus goldi]
MRFVCEVPQFMAICTPLMGLKGNLDMTFTSRFTTEAHQGRLRRKSGLLHHIFVNVALVQAQSVGISLFAALITFAMNIFPMKQYEGREYEEMSLKNFLFLGSTALFAMSASCFISSAGEQVVAKPRTKL